MVQQAKDFGKAFVLDIERELHQVGHVAAAIDFIEEVLDGILRIVFACRKGRLQSDFERGSTQNGGKKAIQCDDMSKVICKF